MGPACTSMMHNRLSSLQGFLPTRRGNYLRDHKGLSSHVQARKRPGVATVACQAFTIEYYLAIKEEAEDEEALKG